MLALLIKARVKRIEVLRIERIGDGLKVSKKSSIQVTSYIAGLAV